MVFSAMIITNSLEGKDWSSLLGAGVTFIIVGLIMVMVNRIITAREEEELAKYVSTRLARTRSGYYLGRDLESGRCSQDMTGSGGQHLRVPRRAMSARVPPSRSPSVSVQMKRSSSARRSGSVRGQPPSPTVTVTASETQPPLSRSPSTYSRLSVRNGNVPPPSYEDAVNYGTPVDCTVKPHPEVLTSPSDSMTEVVTETVVESSDNVPALTVTMQRTSSKRGPRRTDSEDRAASSVKELHQSSCNFDNEVEQPRPPPHPLSTNT